MQVWLKIRSNNLIAARTSSKNLDADDIEDITDCKALLMQKGIYSEQHFQCLTKGALDGPRGEAVPKDSIGLLLKLFNTSVLNEIGPAELQPLSSLTTSPCMLFAATPASNCLFERSQKDIHATPDSLDLAPCIQFASCILLYAYPCMLSTGFQ